MQRDTLPKSMKNYKTTWIEEPEETFKESFGRMSQERASKLASFLTA
jgi:hypothetical protein